MLPSASKARRCCASLPPLPCRSEAKAVTVIISYDNDVPARRQTSSCGCLHDKNLAAVLTVRDARFESALASQQSERKIEWEILHWVTQDHHHRKVTPAWCQHGKRLVLILGQD